MIHFLCSHSSVLHPVCKVIPDFATVVEPLRAVLRDLTDLNFMYTVEAESNFTELKGLIVNGPALAL